MYELEWTFYFIFQTVLFPYITILKNQIDIMNYRLTSPRSYPLKYFKRKSILDFNLKIKYLIFFVSDLYKKVNRYLCNLFVYNKT